MGLYDIDDYAHHWQFHTPVLFDIKPFIGGHSDSYHHPSLIMNLYLVSKWESAYDGIYFTEEKLPVYRVTFTETSTSAKRSNSLTIERATIDSQQNLPKYHSLAEFEFHRKRADVLKINEVTYEADEFFSKQASPSAAEILADSENEKLGRCEHHSCARGK